MNSEQVRIGVLLVAALAIVFGIYDLFSAPSPVAPRSIAKRAVRAAANQVPPLEPVYRLASLPRLEPGRALEFGLGKDGHPLPGNAALISGWSVPEQGGIWSLGKNAVIGFTVQCKTAGCHSDEALLNFEGGALSVPGHLRQTIAFWMNGKKVDQVSLHFLKPRFAIELKGVTLEDGTPVVLTLHLPDAIVPAQIIEGGDARDLAFCISDLRLEL